MIASGIVFNRFFDISLYTKEDIYQRYNPFDVVSGGIEEETLNTTVGGIETEIIKKKIVANDMKIISYEISTKEMASNIFTCCKVLEKASPRLCRVDLIDENLVLFSYPHFSDDIELSNKIESTIEELARLSMFILKLSDDLDDWIKNLSEYIRICYKFTESTDGPEDEVISRQIFVAPNENIDLSEDNKDED